MYFLGIDIGGTFIKSALLSPLENRISHVIRTPIPEFNDVLGPKREISLSKIKSVIQTHFNKYGEFKIEGVLLTHQMHGFVLLDKRGKPASEYISWQDQRSAADFKSLNSLISPEDFKSIGRELKPGYPLATLFSIYKTEQDVNRLTPLTMSEWLASELSETLVNKIDVTNASAFGCFSLNTFKWSEEILSKTKLNQIAWPIVVSANTIVAKMKTSVLVNTISDCPIFISHGDQQMALLGSKLTSTEDVCLNIATGSQCSRISESLKLGTFQTRPYFEDYSLLTRTHIPAGRAINKLFDFFSITNNCTTFKSETYDRLEKLVDGLDDSDLKVFLGFFEGSFEQKGSIENLKESNMTVPNIYRACLNNISDNHYKAALEIDPSKSWKNVLICGGLVQKSKTLKALLRRKFDAPLIEPQFKEDTLVGLLIKSKAIVESSTKYLQIAKKLSSLSLDKNNL